MVVSEKADADDTAKSPRVPGNKPGARRLCYFSAAPSALKGD